MIAIVAALFGGAAFGAWWMARRQRARLLLASQRAETFGSIAESAQDAIVTTDRHGHIASWNAAAERMFSHAKQDALGKPLSLIIPPRHRAAHDAGIARVKAGGPKRVIGRTVELTALDARGVEFPVELSLSTFTVDGEVYFTAILRDVRERAADLAQAEAFQRALLPALRFEGFRVDVLYQPESKVSGDVYDVVALPDGRLRVFVADVTGHGVQASLRTIALKGLYDRHRLSAKTPGELLTLVNRDLVSTLGDRALLAGAACVDVDRSWRVSFANAGLPLPIVLHEGSVTELEGYGSFLGASAETQFVDHQHQAPVQSTIVLYTDGVSYRSTRAADNELWRRVAARQGTLVERVSAELASASEHDLPADDLAMVAVSPA